MATKFPKISIITPSYNQAHFLEQTILSVLKQAYPNLEYWVIDGGSTDGTKKILKKYSEQLQWISEPDNGQTHAINKGLRRAKGDILAYLNSDDLYLSDTLERIAELFKDKGTHWVTGKYDIIDEKGNLLKKHGFVSSYKQILLNVYSPFLLKITNSIIPQPSTFWSKKAFETVGEFNEELHYTMDYDYWLRLSKYFNLSYIPEALSQFRIHTNSKSTTGYTKQFAEEMSVLKLHSANALEIGLHQLHTNITLFAYSLLK